MTMRANLNGKQKAAVMMRKTLKRVLMRMRTNQSKQSPRNRQREVPTMMKKSQRVIMMRTVKSKWSGTIWTMMRMLLMVKEIMKRLK